MRISVRAITFLSISILAAILAAAQERRGVITGRVADASHAVIAGARVQLQPGGQTAVSDGQGQFTISGLAPGQYKVTVSAIGFAQFVTNDLAVTAGGTVNVDASLQVEAKEEVIEVRAERQRGEIEALNRELTADNIVQVLPAEVITSLPNANIADAVGRLPSVSLERDEGEGKYVQIRGLEPRLSNVTVDGVHLPSPESVRNVKLDAIPADLVDSVEVSKTLMANQEGDAIGGSVNLVTKSASNQPYFSVMGMGGYTSIAGGRSNDQFSATYGQRFGKSKQLGIMFGASYDWNGRGIDDMEPGVGVNPVFGNGVTKNGVPQAPTGTFSGPNTVDLRQYWYDRTRYGFGGTLDYKLGDWSSAYLRGLYSEFKDYGQDWIYSPTAGNFLTPTTTDNAGNMAFTHVTRMPEQRLFNLSAGAHHTFGATLLNYELSFGQARFTGSFPRASFVPNGALNNVAFNVDTRNPFVPKFTALGGVNIFDPAQYVLDGITNGNNKTSERDVTGTVSLARTYNAGSHFSTLEVGVKVRDARKAQLFNQQFFAADDTLLMSTMLGTFINRDYYFGQVQHGPTTDYNKILAAFNANRGTFTEQTNTEHSRSDPNNWDTTERVYSAYAMNTITLGRARLQAGVRMESTQGSFLGTHVLFDAAGNFVADTPVRGDQSYTNVLPSVQFQYRFGDKTILRAAYGMGIARPNFGDLPPFISENDKRKQVSVGNPNLKPTKAQNVDLLIERYLKPVGVIEGGVFYKYLTDPIFPVGFPVAGGTFAGFNESQSINGPSAHITGVEMAWQQRLAFLPGALNGIGVRANYSYTTSQANFPATFGRTDHAALARQAPNNWNFDATYDKKGISARMGLTHNDANISQYNFQDGVDGGIKGPNGDIYLYPHTQVDAQVSYWLPKTRGLQVIASFLNLNNEVFGFYQGSEQFPIQREYYNRTYAFGLRWSPSREQK